MKKEDQQKKSQVELYTRVAEILSQSESFEIYGAWFNYLNYGYKPNNNKQYSRIKLPSECMNKWSTKLTLEVIGDVDLNGKKIIEIGCGRGGNIVTMKKYFDSEVIVGVDLCEASIKFCKSHHRLKKVFWCVGDAEYLNFKSNSFPIVFNLESSHAYPNLNKFYHEVFRILKTGGYFLYSDLFKSDRFLLCKQYLLDLGFIIERDHDITSNVLSACNDIASNRMNAFSHSSENSVGLEEFLAVPGSIFYEEMKKGTRTYRILKLRKSMWN